MLSFFKQESGAITTDWVVMTAAVVGLGLTSVTAVRTGTGSLGADIDTSLSGASVSLLGDECKPSASVGNYKFQAFDDKEQASQLDYLSKMRDTDVQKTFIEVSAKADWYKQNDPNSENISAIVDHAALVAGELERRGIDYPKESGTFAQVHENVYGPANTTLCSTAPSSGTESTGRPLRMMETYEDGRILSELRKELAGYETEQLLELADASAYSAKSGIAEGDQKTAGYYLDTMALALDELQSREKPSEKEEHLVKIYDQLSQDYAQTFPDK